MQLFPRFVYGTTVLNGKLWDDQDHLVTDQTTREKLVIELLEDYQIIDKKVRLGQASKVMTVDAT